MKQLKSDIPDNAVEMRVEGCDGLTECVVDGRIVGRRVYNKKGRIVRETALKNGMRHGNEIEWDDDGRLLSVEPYFEGQIHGRAKQYGRSGKVIGTYRFVHGTGYDIWRWEWWEGFAPVSEVHSHAGRCSPRVRVVVGSPISAVFITNAIGARENIMVSSVGGTIGGNCIGDTRSIGFVAKRLPNVSTSKQPSPTRLCRAFGLKITPLDDNFRR